ncbi:MAG: Nif3-like dinuclear metal center hexameric protein [Elusimicrobiales bacterium]|nr:Nif3-like dinuclear metal center hexameric protein [Elusimicrobiales bacterium]
MADRNAIIDFVNEYLNSASIPDISRNGLQIEGKEEIGKIAFGVSASLECMKKAAEGGADMLITHHGLLWGREAPFTGTLKRKLQFMFSHDMNLCAWHLPLDMHPECGNNAQLFKLLGAEIEAPFGKYRGMDTGFRGKFPLPVPAAEILQVLRDKLQSEPFFFRFGKENISTIGIVSGGASDMFAQAIEQKLDLYITGEPSEQSQELARETGSNFIAAGHYNTEKLGVLALANILQEKFGLKTFFADVPNPI